ncbi:MAG: hypothetical protein DMG17_16735, partial [Acidobacteria bacterium]
MLPGRNLPPADGSPLCVLLQLYAEVYPLIFRYSKLQETMFMNTRLLMMLRVKVGTPQNLGAVPLG